MAPRELGSNAMIGCPNDGASDRRTVRLSEAPSYGQPIITFDPSSRGAIAYRELAKEVSGGTPQRTR